MEQYFNQFTTTVSGGYTSGSGILNVASTTGITLAAGDTCRLLVYRLGSGSVSPIVLFKVTAVNSSTQFAVTAEGSDANALAGDNVICVNTIGAMNQIRKDINQVGIYASLPASPKQGDRYRPTDIAIDEFVYDGSIWQPFVGGKNVVLPINANYSWLNQGSASVSSNGVVLLKTDSEAINIRSRIETATYTTPFSVEIGFYATILGVNQMWAGLLLKNSGAALILTFNPMYSGGFSLQVNKWNSVSSFNTGFASVTLAPAISAKHFLKFLDDGTNLNWYTSADGYNWISVATMVRTAYLATPDTWGFFILNLSSGFNAMPVTVFHVKKGTT